MSPLRCSPADPATGSTYCAENSRRPPRRLPERAESWLRPAYQLLSSMPTPSAVSILLPAISEDTGMSVDTLQWAVTGYSLVGAAVIITSGSLGDVFGRKRIFQLGLLLFVVSCVMIALAGSGEMVIAGRLIQGASGATILACGLSLLSVATTGEANLRAVSLWGAAAAVGAAAGPLLGGVLVDLTGWQGLFWIDAVVAALCMLLTYATVSESRDP